MKCNNLFISEFLNLYHKISILEYSEIVITYKKYNASSTFKFFTV